MHVNFIFYCKERKWSMVLENRKMAGPFVAKGL